MVQKNPVLLGLGMLLWAGVLAACGGGETATPTPRLAPTSTAVTAATPRPTAAPQPTATPQPIAATPRPAATPVPTATPSPTTRRPQGKFVAALANFGTEDRDPITSSSATMPIVGGPLYDWAVWFNRDGSLAPGVFERWEQAADGLSWTFTIRDMSFHSGDPVTAADVKFNFERVLTPASVGANSPVWKAALASVEAVSPKTAVARLKTPWPTLPFALAPADGSQGVIYPKAAFERAGTAFFSKPVGTGPFKFVDHQLRVRLMFEATGQKHPYRRQPDMQTLEFLYLPEESTRVAALKTGAADVISIGPDNIAALKGAGFSILQVPDVNVVALKFYGLDNVPAINTVPTGSVKVREALHLAIDVKEIVDVLLGGYATIPARDVVVRGTEGFDPAWQPRPHNPARSRDLLREEGYAKGLIVRLFNPTLPIAPWSTRVGEAVAGYWAAVGVETNVIAVEYAAWRPYYSEKPHQRALGAYGWLFNTKTPNSIRPLAQFASNSPQGLLKNPEIDNLMDRAATVRDQNERVQIIRQVVDYAYRNFVTIPIAVAPDLYAAAPSIAGWEPIEVTNAGLSWETMRRK